jgi:hypothetical protein
MCKRLENASPCLALPYLIFESVIDGTGMLKKILICPCRRINKSPMSIEEPEKSYLKKMLTEPPVKKIDLHFPLGLEVTARNLKGVTIKDALDAIYKQYRKKVSLFSPTYPSLSGSSHPLLSSPQLLLQGSLYRRLLTL